eukprot:scaffold1033_cov171-Amphora_coffeaeformis.AAC.5
MTTSTTTPLESTPVPAPKSKTSFCQGCQREFPSRNAVFSHLKKTGGACLTGKAYADFIANVPVPDEKVILLYGYRLDHSGYRLVPTGNAAADILLDTSLDTSLMLRESALHGESAAKSRDVAKQLQRPKYLRSYGNTARKTNNDMIAEDEGFAGALTEVLATRLPPIGIPVEDWVQLVNENIDKYLKEQASQRASKATTSEHGFIVEPRIVLFGRRHQPGNLFNAEMDVSHRRMDYVLPGQLHPAHPDYNKGEINLTSTSLEYMKGLKRAMQKLTTHIVALDVKDADAVEAKTQHLRKRNKLRQKQRSKDKSVLEKSKVKSDDNQSDNGRESKDDDAISKSTIETAPGVVGNVLKRKSFHNFTPTVMAHEYLANRRLDRFFHKATLHVENNAYLLLSLTGDLFLQGQVCRVIGTWLAIHRGLIDEDFIDCVFDKDYPSLVPTPPAPPQGMYAQNAFYLVWEGKSHSCLTPRLTDCYPEGWNDIRVLRAVHSFGDSIRRSVVEEWESDEGVCKRWIRETLEPWATKAREHLENYRQWKAEKDNTEGKVTLVVVESSGSKETTPVPRPSVLDTSSGTAPKVYQSVLFHLRHIYESGQWPGTSAKRQVVMVTEHTSNNGSQGGSFSVGYMPRLQPRANAHFPEFVKAAFALERAIMPDRPPSSTIAVNRNAQFRPCACNCYPFLPACVSSSFVLRLTSYRHVDSGAGAGQSTSLIVGLGDYTGGGLMVEGEEHDIRYRPIEFNGWKQRHWTLPFEGERFSLVWFTPKECQGMCGVNLELPAKI